MIRIPFLKKSQSDNKSDKRLLECVFCFGKNTFSATDIVGIAESNPVFKITYMEVSGEPVPFTEKERNKLMSVNTSQSNKTGIKFLDESQSNSIQFVYPPASGNAQIMHWVFDSENISALESTWLKSLCTNDFFVVGYCADKNDMFMQSTTIYQFYQKKNIKPIKTVRNEFGDITVDVSQNPGRRKLVKGMWLMSCWRMWFGKNFYSIIPKEKLLSFPNASSVKQMENEVISIELYSDAFGAADERNRKLQNAFREWINMDQLEKELS